MTSIVMDLAQPLNLSALPLQIDVVVHLAQANVLFPKGAHELFAVNTGSTQQLLDYCRKAGVRRFILASTGDVYAPHLGVCKEGDLLAPRTYYGVTKYAAEMLSETYADYFQICILRLFQPYGPDQHGRLVAKLISAIEDGRTVRLNRGDRPHVSPVYIDDCVTAIERAVGSSHSGAINIAGDQVVTIREIAETIGQVMQIKPDFAETADEAADQSGDNQLMKDVFGEWSLSSLAEGLSRTLKSRLGGKCRTHA